MALSFSYREGMRDYDKQIVRDIFLFVCWIYIFHVCFG